MVASPSCKLRATDRDSQAYKLSCEWRESASDREAMSQLLQYYKSFRTQGGANTQNAAPTFEDLAIDDELTELERVVTYTKSSIGLQR